MRPNSQGHQQRVMAQQQPQRQCQQLLHCVGRALQALPARILLNWLLKAGRRHLLCVHLLPLLLPWVVVMLVRPCPPVASAGGMA